MSNNNNYFIYTSHTENKKTEYESLYFEVYDFIKNIHASNEDEALGQFLKFNHDIYKDILIKNREHEIKKNPEHYARYNCDNINEYKENLIVEVKINIINKNIEEGFLIASTLEIFPSINDNEINKIYRYYLFKK